MDVMDGERLRRYIDKLGHIEERIEDIRSWLCEVEDFDDIDKKTRLAVYRAMQEVIEAATDVVAMILKDESKLPKDDYTNINKLFKIGIIDKSLREVLNEANGLRNRLVHDYNGLNDKIALKSIQHLLVPMSNFSEAVKKWMRKRE
jgi:Uncharacterized conserved protein